MPLSLTPTSELEAVNELLRIIGQSPVNTLEVDGLLDVSDARQELHSTSRALQTLGWGWNTDENYTLTRQSPSGYAAVPATALDIDPVDKDLDLVQRYNPDAGIMCLWDRTNHTFVLSKDPEVNITWFFPFEQLPQAARHFITIAAGRVFQERTVGSGTLSGFSEKDEQRAWRALSRSERRSRDTNIFAGPDRTNRILFRRRYALS